MRPKKIILLIDPQEDRRSTTAFVLETNGFLVLTAPSVYAAAEVAHDPELSIPDLLVGYAPISHAYMEQLADDLDRPCRFIGPEDRGELQRNAWPPMAEVLERIKRAAARKRGPRKGCAPVRKSTTHPASTEVCA